MMKKLFIALAALGCLLNAATAQTKIYYVKLKTAQGSCILRLYNETPLHRDNFVRLVKSRYFNHTTFNRILKGFVVQGGDPDSLYLPGKKLNPEQKWLKPELTPALFHKRGALAMGRDDNPAKKSFSTQIYIVDGKTYTDAQLDAVEQKYHRHIPAAQREVYKTIGGTPFLDGNYTVFGEIVKGTGWIDQVTAVKVNAAGNPDTEVKMQLTLLTPRQAATELK